MIENKQLSSNIQIKYSFINHLDTDINEFANFERISGDIVLMDFENDKETKIGHIILYLYNAYMGDYGCSMRNAFDKFGDTYQIYEALYDGEYISEEIEDKIGMSDNFNMLVIHEIMLMENYRGKGYGEQIIEGIEAFFTGKCGYISLKSYPLQHDKSYKGTVTFDKYKLGDMESDLDKANEKLNAFYEKCGFIKVELDYEHDGDFFIKNLLPM